MIEKPMHHPNQKKVRNFLATLLVLIYFSTGTSANEGAAGPLVQIAQAFLGGASSLNIESATLGIDKGIIANTVIGIGRKIERNPSPTGAHDQYLVKDRMRLGFELGAGLVAAGTVTYAQEWTLVYPVSEKMDGLLSRKFIVDLFLFYRATKLIKENIPGDYALLRESFIEGKGRLKIGGASGFLLGNQASASRIKMNTVLIKASDKRKKPLQIMRQKSKFTKLAYELWINLIAFDLPIFDARNEAGVLERQYYDISLSRKNRKKRDQIVRDLFSGQNEEIYQDFKVNRKVTSRFKEISLDFTLFFVFDRERLTRVDDISDTLFVMDQEGNETAAKTERTWQWENRGNHEWTTGLNSEQYKSRMFLTGKPIENERGITTSIENPQLEIQLKIIDDETSNTEGRDIYLPLLSHFARQEHNKEALKSNILSKEPESHITINLQYNESALFRLMNTTEDQWYEALQRVTQRKLKYWKQAALGGLHSRDRRRLRQTRLPMGDLQLASQIRRLIYATNRAKKSVENSRNVLGLRKLLRGLRTSFVIGKGAFDTRLLQVVNSLIDAQDLHSTTSFKIFQDKKNTSPIEYVSEKGKPLWKNEAEYQFLFEDPSEIYFFFNERQEK